VDDPTTPIVQEEVFGPVATFEVFDPKPTRCGLPTSRNTACCVDLVPRTSTGRGGSDGKLRAGTVWTNTWALVADQFEEGGFGQSGLGRLNGLRGLEEFQEYKTYAQIVG